MNKNFITSLSATLLLVLLVGTTHAESIDGKRILQSATEAAIEGGFTELERQTIGKYYDNKRYWSYVNEDSDYRGKKSKAHKGKGKKKGLPPGLAKKDRLPPGLQKQLARNGTLPPGLAKRDLPPDLTADLPPVQEGFERVIADTSVILVHKATGVIKDIIRDILK